MSKEKPSSHGETNQEILPSNPEEYKLGLTQALRYLKGNKKPLNFIFSTQGGNPVLLSIFDQALSHDEIFFFAQIVKRQDVKVSTLSSDNPLHLVVANNRDIFELTNELLSHIRFHYPIAVDLPIMIYSSLGDMKNNRPALKIAESGRLIRPRPTLSKRVDFYQPSLFDNLSYSF